MCETPNPSRKPAARLFIETLSRRGGGQGIARVDVGDAAGDDQGCRCWRAATQRRRIPRDPRLPVSTARRNPRLRLALRTRRNPPRKGCRLPPRLPASFSVTACSARECGAHYGKNSPAARHFGAMAQPWRTPDGLSEGHEPFRRHCESRSALTHASSNGGIKTTCRCSSRATRRQAPGIRSGSADQASFVECGGQVRAAWLNTLLTSQ